MNFLFIFSSSFSPPFHALSISSALSIFQCHRGLLPAGFFFMLRKIIFSIPFIALSCKNTVYNLSVDFIFELIFYVF